MKAILYSNKSQSSFLLRLSLLIISSLGVILAIYFFLPVGQDWWQIRNAILDMLAGRSPFLAAVFNPPWILILLIPFALLPFKLGAAILAFINFAVFGFAALRFGKSPLLAALLLITPAMIRQVIDPNLEFFVVLGLLLPPEIGIFLILAKPQLGAPIVLFWLFEAWHQGGFRRVLRLLAPISFITIISFIFFGFWPLHALSLPNTAHNYSLWPTSLIFGLPLFLYALRNRRQDLTLISIPFLAPYYGFYSLHIPLLGFLPSRWETIAAVIGFWIMFLIG